MAEVDVNTFEYVTTDTEQVQVETAEPKTVAPVNVPAVEQPAVQFPAQAEFAESEFISYELSYSCLLIPRFPDHYLTGDITDDLPQWLKSVCISYGWRLGEVMIRPGYIQWVITVPLTTNPAQFMRVIRQLTSQKILEYYPRYKRQNLSLDFWAPGFSVAPGKQFQTDDNIHSFILQTRRNQGITC